MTTPSVPTPLAAAQPGDTPERSLEEQRGFFDAAMERCLDAEARTGVARRQFDVAGTRVEFVFAGERFLQPLTAALMHLHEPDPATPDLTIHVWDTASSGVEMAPSPCTKDCFTDRGEMWGMMHPRVRSAYHHWHEFSLNLLDLDRRVGVYWVGVEQQLPYWTEAAPFRTLLHWWMEEQGAQLLHAAAVGTHDGALLITGKGGVGKSTTALTCLSAGMQYVGDDYLIVRLDPEPRAYSLYSTAKLDARAVQRFPELLPHVSYTALTNDEKMVIQLLPRYADQVQRSLPLKAVATPSFGHDARTVVRPGSPIELQRAAEFTTISQLPHAGRAAHAFIDRMIHTLPGLHLELGHDIATIPDTIRELVGLDRTALDRIATPETIGSATAVAALPLVSVIIPMFNGVDFLPAAVRNALAQGHPSVDIIVVDDGSFDDVPAALSALPVDVRYFRQMNGGPASARNRGIKVAGGEFLAFLDVDDLWPVETLRRLAQMLVQQPDVDVVRGFVQITRFDTYDQPGEFIGSPAETFPYSIGAGMYRRSAFERIGLFDGNLRFGEDSDWYLRAREAGLRVLQLDEITMYARRHPKNMTHGRSAAELNPLQLVKNAIDRRRAAALTTPPDPPPQSPAPSGSSRHSS